MKQKPWDLCQVMMCRRPTKSGEKERDLAKRYCRYHFPNGSIEKAHARQRELRELRSNQCLEAPFLPTFVTAVQSSVHSRLGLGNGLKLGLGRKYKPQFILGLNEGSTKPSLQDHWRKLSSKFCVSQSPRMTGEHKKTLLAELTKKRNRLRAETRKKRLAEKFKKSIGKHFILTCGACRTEDSLLEYPSSLKSEECIRAFLAVHGRSKQGTACEKVERVNRASGVLLWRNRSTKKNTLRCLYCGEERDFYRHERRIERDLVLFIKEHYDCAPEGELRCRSSIGVTKCIPCRLRSKHSGLHIATNFADMRRPHVWT